MKRLAVTSFSWFALLVAIVLWVGIGFFAWTLSEEESARAKRLARAGEEAQEQYSSLRVVALARETKDTRAKLEETVSVEIEEMLDSITNAGKSIGVPITIGESLSISARKEDSALRALVFIVEVQGTFSQVVSAMALLESLPVPSTLDQVQFERFSDPEGSAKNRGSRWRAVGRIQFFTTTEIPA